MKSDHFSWRSGAIRPKVWYATEVSATAAAVRVGAMYQMVMEPYKCNGCSGWHIGEQRVYRPNQAGLTMIFADFVAATMRGKPMNLAAVIARNRARFEATR
jgi:hypothetical protein